MIRLKNEENSNPTGTANESPLLFHAHMDEGGFLCANFCFLAGYRLHLDALALNYDVIRNIR